MFLLSKHYSVLPPQFLLIFRKSAAGELAEDSGLCVLARLSEIDVSTEGVKGAKTFFEAKVRRLVTPVTPGVPWEMVQFHLIGAKHMI